MNWFYLSATLMALLAAAFAAWPLLRSRRTNRAAPEHDAANVAVYSDQLSELQSDLSNKLLTQAQFDLARNELERRVLQDVPAQQGGAEKVNNKTAPYLGIALALAIPLGGALLYYKLGNPGAMISPPVDPALAQLQQVQALLPKLEQRLREKPDDVTGWTMLGKANMALEHYPEAVNAYAKLTALTPQDAQAYADYADALAMANGQTLLGKPRALIAQALKLDPNNGKARYLAGFAALEAGQPKEAIVHWEKLLKQIPPDSPGAAMLQEKLAQLKHSEEAAPLAGAKNSVANGATISGQVRLAATLRQFAAPQDTLFVFARALSGPKMPLALLKAQVKDLPVNFSLDDSMAMSPQMKLSNFPEVVIVARVSKSGTALTQPGDLEGVSAPVKLGAKQVTVEISQKIP